MTKLAKYLKPFIIPLVLAIFLLYGQSQADLALPSYMSDIINVGIQQSGFEDGVTEVLTVEEFDKLKLFLSEEEELQIEKDYFLIDSNHNEYDTYKERFPNLDSTFYILVQDNDEMEYLYKEMMMISGIEAAIVNEDTSVYDELNIPYESDLYEVFSLMPKEAISTIIETQIESFGVLGETVLEQSAITYTKSLYEDLGYDTGSMQTGYIINIGLIMIGVTILGAIASILVGFIASKIAAGVGRNLREQIFEKITSFSNGEFDEFGTSSLITRSTNDINQVQNLLVILIRLLFYAPLLGIGGFIKVMDTNANMAWIIGVAIGAIIISISIIFTFVIPKFQKVQKLTDKLNLVMREKLSGLLVIRAFNTEKFQEKRFEEVNEDLTNTNLFVNRMTSLLFPIMMFVMNATTILIVWVAAHEIAEATMQVGDMIAFMQYGIQIIMSFLILSMMFILIPRAAVSAKRINEVLEIEPSIIDKKKSKKVKKAKGIIKFDNVSFRYKGAEEDMIKGISFEAIPGKTTAIIGSTGSGKTTILNLIPRFYDVTYGSITIDKIDIRDMKQKELREMIGYVPQKSVLFSGTIESNIKFSDDNLSDEIMKKSLKIAQGESIIKEKEYGYETDISQGGTNVSGGQKQRLAIARTIAKDPLIYLFDDSFSALDYKTDVSLRKALAKTTKDKTVLIIAQRISTIKNADQIIVLEDGNIVGKGNHEQLMKSCETYKEIAYSQLSKEELA